MHARKTKPGDLPWAKALATSFDAGISLIAEQILP
jgi:hypothetical protein